MHVVFADCLVLFVWLSNIFLRIRGLEPISGLDVAIVTAYGGFATVGYFTVNAVRACSLNKRDAQMCKYENRFKEGDFK